MTTAHAPLPQTQRRLLELLAAQVETDTVVEHEGATDLGRRDQDWQKNHTDDHVGVCGNLAQVDGALLVLSHVPAVQVGDKDEVHGDGMGDGGLDPRHHGVLGFALGVLFPRTTVLLDHADQLDVSRHDGGHGGDETGTHEEERDASDVEEGGLRAKAASEELGLESGGCEIEDVESPCQDVEGDWEMDETWMGGESGDKRSILCSISRGSGCFCAS
jgi:hypothetical protein